MGPLSLPLTPLPGTPSQDRPGGYYIHGCRRKGPVCSQGCVVVDPKSRQAINDAGGGIVEVSPGEHDLSPGCSGGVCKI